VLIGKRQQNQVAGFDLVPGAARRLDHAVALGHEMKDADMAQMRHRHAFVIAFGRDDSERRGQARTEKDRAGQANRAQHFRQGVGLRRRGQVGRRFGTGRRCLDHCPKLAHQ